MKTGTMLAISLATLLSGCVVRTFTQKRMLIANEDRVLYTGKNSTEFPGEIALKSSDPSLGKVAGEFPYLIYKPSQGPNKRIWRYYDYSMISKISLSKDEKTLRVYHSHQLLFNRDYVSELDLRTLKLRGYRYPKHAPDNQSKKQ